MEIDYSEKTLKLLISFKKDNVINEKFEFQSIYELTSFLTGLQLTYEIICEALDVQPHHLEVSDLQYPNMSISLEGIGEPIKLFKEVLECLPNVVVGLCTIPYLVKEEIISIQINIELKKELLKTVRSIKNAPQQHRKQLLNKIWAYQFPGEFDGVAKGLSIQEYPQNAGGFADLSDLLDSPDEPSAPDAVSDGYKNSEPTDVDEELQKLRDQLDNSQI